MSFNCLANFATGGLPQPALDQVPGFVLVLQPLSPRDRIAKDQQIQGPFGFAIRIYGGLRGRAEGKQKERRNRGERETFRWGYDNFHEVEFWIVTQSQKRGHYHARESPRALQKKILKQI